MSTQVWSRNFFFRAFVYHLFLSSTLIFFRVSHTDKVITTTFEFLRRIVKKTYCTLFNLTMLLNLSKNLCNVYTLYYLFQFFSPCRSFIISFRGLIERDKLFYDVCLFVWQVVYLVLFNPQNVENQTINNLTTFYNPHLKATTMPCFITKTMTVLLLFCVLRCYRVLLLRNTIRRSLTVRRNEVNDNCKIVLLIFKYQCPVCKLFRFYVFKRISGAFDLYCGRLIHSFVGLT